MKHKKQMFLWCKKKTHKWDPFKTVNVWCKEYVYQIVQLIQPKAPNGPQYAYNSSQQAAVTGYSHNENWLNGSFGSWKRKRNYNVVKTE